MKLAHLIFLGALALASVVGARADTAPPPPPSPPAYVASAKSQVFHRPDCSWAKKISPNNLQTFKTREEAVQAAKRPCRVCKP